MLESEVADKRFVDWNPDEASILDMLNATSFRDGHVLMLPHIVSTLRALGKDVSMTDKRLSTNSKRLAQWFFPKQSEEDVLSGVRRVWEERLKSCHDQKVRKATAKLLKNMDVPQLRSLNCKVMCVMDNFAEPTNPTNGRREDIPTACTSSAAF